MLRSIAHLFTNNIGLKIIALILSLVLWFYVGKELSRESEGERNFLKKILPSENVSAKRLPVRPTLEGSPQSGYIVDLERVTAAPNICTAVGQRDVLDKITYASTVPININGASRAVTKSIPLRSIPGVYVEDTVVRVTIPIQKIGRGPD